MFSTYKSGSNALRVDDSIVPALASLYGEQVASEFELIDSILHRIASERKIDLDEGALDAFCRARHTKLASHSQKSPDEHFERVRLLNMMYEGCLEFLTEATTALQEKRRSAAVSAVKRASDIIEYLTETISPEKGGEIAKKLIPLYEFSQKHLEAARRRPSIKKLREVSSIMNDIYLAYLTIELELDTKKFLRERVTA